MPRVLDGVVLSSLKGTEPSGALNAYLRSFDSVVIKVANVEGEADEFFTHEVGFRVSREGGLCTTTLLTTPS
jgi:hypothetical protein